jgi:predicted O-methyltransferase YrrM
MPTTSPPSNLDPLPLLRMRDGIYAPDLLIAAIAEFDFFNRLAERPRKPAELVAMLGIRERPLEVMVTLFAAMGLVERGTDGVGLSHRAEAFLTGPSQWDMSPYFASLKLRPQIREIVSVLTTDRPASWESATSNPEWATAMQDDAFARRFTAAMHGRGEWLGPALAAALDLGDRASLLDIGGGSGVYARILQERYPELRVAVLERPPVDRATRSHLGETPSGQQVAVLGGDMFASIPTGFEAHLFSNVLHDWGEAKVRELLAKSRSSLPPGGLVAVHDAFIDRDRRGPLAVAEYSVLLMLLSEGQCYSLGEMEDLLLGAGFRDVEYRETIADRGVMTARAD